MATETAGLVGSRPAGLVRVRVDLMAVVLGGLLMAFLPWLVRDAALIGALAVMFVWLTVNVSWNLVLGYAGILSFGQLAFFAVGAYTAAIFNTHLGLSPWADTFLAALGGGLAALVIGLAVIRLRGIYVALVTLAFHQLLNTLISTDYSGLTGGPNGLSAGPYIATPNLLTQSNIGFYLSLAAAAAITLVILMLVNSPVGLALVAARDAEHVATARGIWATKYRLVAFVVSGLVAGLMGGFYAHYTGVVSPTIFSFGILIGLLSMILVGGWGTIWGPIIGTIVVTLISRYLQGAVPQYQALFLAIILVLAVLLLPGGLASGATRGIRRLLTAWEHLE